MNKAQAIADLSFELAGVTSTERALDIIKRALRMTGLANATMIDDVQMNALKGWLADNSKRVKFVATSVPFFPDLRGSGKDRWDSFARQRNEILEHIRTKGIRKVAFLSGDVHSSMSAELHHAQDPNFKVISIVSSPFYWPYPHSKAADFTVTGDLHGAPRTHEYPHGGPGPDE